MSFLVNFLAELYCLSNCILCEILQKFSPNLHFTVSSWATRVGRLLIQGSAKVGIQ